MKSTALASAILVAAAAAQPHVHARHGHGHGNVNHQNAHRHIAERKLLTSIEWHVVTQTVTEIIGAETTYLVTGPVVQQPYPTPPAASSPSSSSTEAEETTTPVATPTYSTPAEEITSTTQQTTEQPVYTPPPSSAAPPPPPPPQSSSSVYVPPPPPPKSSAPVYIAPPLPPTSIYVPPVPIPSPSAPVYQPPSAGSMSGDITYYTLGMGACGVDNSGQDESDYIVAISWEDMGAQSNGNPLCGKKIRITANGNTITGTIQDKCMGCKSGSIDVSSGAFEKLWGGLGQGRGPCTWEYI